MTASCHAQARAVQTAVLERISEDAVLQNLFRLGGGPSPQRPSLSFDEMQSTPQHKEIGLVEHRLQFSLWAEPHDADQAAELGTLVEGQFVAPLAIDGCTVLYMNLLELRSAMHWPARAWRAQLEFRLLTQSLISQK